MGPAKLPAPVLKRLNDDLNAVLALPEVKEVLARDPNQIYRLRDVTIPSLGRRVKYRESFDYDSVTQVLVIHMHFVDPTVPRGQPGHHWWAPLSHRQLFPQELEALMHHNGFAIEERYGGFEKQPLDEHAVQQILVCKVRRGWRAR